MAETNEPEVIFLKGEGGSVFRFERPLHPDIAKTYAAQRLTRVAEDGEPYIEGAEPTKLTPKQKLQAEARELGVGDAGTAEEIQARVTTRRALVGQAAELELDATGTDDELRGRIDAKLAE